MSSTRRPGRRLLPCRGPGPASSGWSRRPTTGRWPGCRRGCGPAPPTSPTRSTSPPGSSSTGPVHPSVERARRSASLRAVGRRRGVGPSPGFARERARWASLGAANEGIGLIRRGLRVGSRRTSSSGSSIAPPGSAAASPAATPSRRWGRSARSWEPGGAVLRLDGPLRLSHVQLALPGGDRRVCRNDGGRTGRCAPRRGPRSSRPFREAGAHRVDAHRAGHLVDRRTVRAGARSHRLPNPIRARRRRPGMDADGSRMAQRGRPPTLDEALRIYDLGTPSAAVTARWWSMPTCEQDVGRDVDRLRRVGSSNRSSRCGTTSGLVALYPKSKTDNPFGDWEAGPGTWWLRQRGGLDVPLFLLFGPDISSGDIYLGNVGGGFRPPAPFQRTVLHPAQDLHLQLPVIVEQLIIHHTLRREHPRFRRLPEPSPRDPSRVASRRRSRLVQFPGWSRPRPGPSQPPPSPRCTRCGRRSASASRRSASIRATATPHQPDRGLHLLRSGGGADFSLQGTIPTAVVRHGCCRPPASPGTRSGTSHVRARRVLRRRSRLDGVTVAEELQRARTGHSAGRPYGIAIGRWPEPRRPATTLVGEIDRGEGVDRAAPTFVDRWTTAASTARSIDEALFDRARRRDVRRPELRSGHVPGGGRGDGWTSAARRSAGMASRFGGQPAGGVVGPGPPIPS